MTEGQEAAAAPVPWSGAGRGVPAGSGAPERHYAGAGMPAPEIAMSGAPTPPSFTLGPTVPSAAFPQVEQPVAGSGVAGADGQDSNRPRYGGPAAGGQRPDRPDAEGGMSSAERSPGQQHTAPGGGASAVPGVYPVAAPAAAVSRPAAEAGVAGPPGRDEPGDDEPFTRVDARKLEAALLGLRHPIVTVPLPLEAPGVAEARAERHKLLSQIDDYLLPRLRQSSSPILVSLVGSTGAGKSTLLNSIVGKQVSATGIRRPTTNSPVLACHPDDVRWFAENVFLPTLPRVRQEGLAMPGRDGLLVLATSEGMPKGVALLDTPDIDSVVQAHRDFANQFLDASDLWLFVTTARRYADAAVWELLKDARDRGAALAIALSRVPPAATVELAAHFAAMLEANGLGDIQRFIIPETDVTDAMLPPGVAVPVQEWLADTAKRDDRRVAVLTQTMSGVLDTFRSRVPALADQVTDQLAIRTELREFVEGVYAAGLAEFDEATRNGSLLRGEVLARWQDFAGTGDLLRTLQVRRGRPAKPKKQRLSARATGLKTALQASLESLVESVADRAAEQAVLSWQQMQAGAALLAGLEAAHRRGSGAPPGEADFLASALADLGVAGGSGGNARTTDPASLSKASPGLAALAVRAISNWQEHVLHLVRAENVTKRSIARVASFDDESLALVLTIGVLGYAASEVPVSEGASAVPQQLLTSLFGAGLLRDMGARVRLDLRERVGLLFAEEAWRFFAIVDSAGLPHDTAATELLQAGYALEGAR
jgi:50S ribosome-binding GTPase